MLGKTFKARAKTFGLTVAMVVAGMGAQAETLADAMANAYKNSGLIDQNRALLRAADEDVAIATSALRPILNWSASYKRSAATFASASTGYATAGSGSFGTDLSVSGELMLYDNGASKKAIEAAKYQVLATRQALISVEQDVLLRAVRAFMNVRRETENVSLRENNLRLISEELRAARNRFDVGEVTRTDVALAEARLAASQAALAASQGQLTVAKEEYRAVVGALPGKLTAPKSLPKVATSLDAARAEGRKSHPNVIQAQHGAKAADLNAERAALAMRPTTKLVARANFSDTRGSDAFTESGEIGIQMSGPLYSGGRLPAVARQAQARKDSARAQLHVTTVAVEQAIGNAFAQLQIARAAKSANAQQIEAAQVAFAGVKEEATLGARTTLDVLNAEQELLNARASMISATVDEQIAAYGLMAAMGILTVDHLRLDVPRYDPTEYYNAVKSAPTKSKQGSSLDKVMKKLGKN